MHNIGYLTYNEKITKSEVMAYIQEIAEREGDGYSSKMTWHDTLPPFETEEEARRFIKEKDNGWYDDHAVRFKDYSKATKTAKIIELEQKIQELKEAARKYRDEHLVQKFQAKFIGCQHCGSKISKDFLYGQLCPICRTDLRSKTTLEKIEWYGLKIDEYRKRIEVEKQKQKKNCRIMWLVKYEYHS